MYLGGSFLRENPLALAGDRGAGPGGPRARAPYERGVFTVATVVATGVASLSYQLLEQPIAATAPLAAQ